MIYNINDLVYVYSIEEIWNIPIGKHQIVFDDGAVIDTTRRKIIISHYYWNLYRVVGFRTKVLSTHIVIKYSKRTHRELGGSILHHIHDSNPSKQTMELLTIEFPLICNKIYNMTRVALASFTPTVSMIDVMEVVTNEKIVSAKKTYYKTVNDPKSTEEAIVKAIDNTKIKVGNTLYGSFEGMSHNGIYQMCRANILNKDQLLQFVGPRGYPSDLGTGGIFKRPINNGYSEGMTNLYSLTTESRSAGRALMANTIPLQDSEQFKREMQLIASVIHSIEHDNCVGYSTINYTVHKGDLPLLKGKNHMVKDKPTMIMTQNDIEALIGSTIKIRSITGCGNDDTQTVCKVCAGYISNTLGDIKNLGHEASTFLNCSISLKILGTKHLENSAKVKYLKLDRVSSKWLALNVKDNAKVMLSNEVNDEVVIRVPIEFVQSLSVILNTSIDSIIPSKVTRCKHISIAIRKDNGKLSTFDNVLLGVSGVGSSMSSDLLTHLVDNGWRGTNKYIEFTLKDWDKTKPLFITPRIGDNIILFLKEVTAFMYSNILSPFRITECTTRSIAINELITILNGRLRGQFNMIEVETFIRVCMVKLDGSWSLPDSVEPFEFKSVRNVLKNRCLTGVLAYQQQYEVIFNPKWYVKQDRNIHLLDSLLIVK